MGLALIMYGREEEAETLIEQMSRDQDPILRCVCVLPSNISMFFQKIDAAFSSDMINPTGYAICLVQADRKPQYMSSDSIQTT